MVQSYLPPAALGVPAVAMDHSSFSCFGQAAWQACFKLLVRHRAFRASGHVGFCLPRQAPSDTPLLEQRPDKSATGRTASLVAEVG